MSNKQHLPSLLDVYKESRDVRFSLDKNFQFLPGIHRPEQPSNWDGLVNNKKSNWRPLHDDYPCWPVNKIPRTVTSFIIKNPPVMLEGNQTHWCNFDNGTVSYSDKQPGERWGPKPWPLRGQWQRSVLFFYNPITEEEYYGIYFAIVNSDGLGYRNGPRWTDPAVDSPWNYVNYMPFGTTQIKRIK